MGFGKTYQYWLNNLSEQPAGHAEEHDLDMVWAGIEEELILDEAWTGIDALLEPALTSMFHRPGFTIFLGSMLVFVLLLWRSDVFIPGQDEIPPNIPEINSPQQELLLDPARRINSRTAQLQTETVESADRNDDPAMSHRVAGAQDLKEKTEKLQQKLYELSRKIYQNAQQQSQEQAQNKEQEQTKKDSGNKAGDTVDADYTVDEDKSDGDDSEKK